MTGPEAGAGREPHGIQRISSREPSFKSRPDLRPPPIAIHVRPRRTAAGLFVTECHGGSGQQGPLAFTDSGELVWFNPVSADGTRALRAFNVRVQRYKGEPVLSWFEGAVVEGHGDGHYVIADSSYETVTTVRAAGGLTGDLHEFLLTERGTAIFSAYAEGTADLSSLKGPKRATYWYGVVQEVDVATGKLLFSWRSDRHVGFSESYGVPGASGTWDYFHLNSIAVDPADGRLVVSGRDTWACYKLDTTTGRVIWRLGGKKSDFAIPKHGHFAYQHDVTPQRDGTFTIFDNEGTPWHDPPSRALILKVDQARRRANVLRAYRHSPPVLAGTLGSVQDLADGHVVVGWGTSPYFSEYGSSGKLLCDGRLLGKGIESYRVFKSLWTGLPKTPPSIAVERSGGQTTVYASWNGSTETARWRVLGAGATGSLSYLTTVDKAGFETRVSLDRALKSAAVEALDSGGRLLGRSAVKEA